MLGAWVECGQLLVEVGRLHLNVDRASRSTTAMRGQRLGASAGHRTRPQHRGEPRLSLAISEPSVREPASSSVAAETTVRVAAV
ncbi:hypothetical protein AWU67_06355 [Microterricola viridarii]|uniref:Uncharacterized protein n=1 Tax=Microterricola viridarii TaxID=412690 RepID=A0A0X8E3X6_9MICO|nr:hypothetical protein AWU67_06355 [Microterricola viridarii]